MNCMNGQQYSGWHEDSQDSHVQPQGASIAGLSGGGYTQKSAILGRTKVQRLVRTHTNIFLEGSLEGWCAKTLPWEIDMQVESDGSSGDSEDSEG